MGDKKTKNKIQASAFIVVIVLLTGGLLAAVGINDCSASIVTQSVIALETVGVADEAAVTVVINELMADNEATIQSPDGTSSDWIELFNNGDNSVDLSGMYLTDDLTNPTWQFPAGTVIEAYSYLLVWADGDSGQDALHADFKLNANGETVALLASDGETVLDSITFGKQIEDVSYGRLPDGSASWSYMTTSSAGEANAENARSTLSTPWPIWLFIALTLTACIAVLVKDKIRARRKQ